MSYDTNEIPYEIRKLGENFAAKKSRPRGQLDGNTLTT
jgi:hypothetical protein